MNQLAQDKALMYLGALLAIAALYYHRTLLNAFFKSHN